MTISITHLTITEQTVLNVISDRSVVVSYVCFLGAVGDFGRSWLSWYCITEGRVSAGGGGMVVWCWLSSPLSYVWTSVQHNMLHNKTCFLGVLSP